MLETVLPLSLSVRLGISFGSDCDLEAILLSFYCRCFTVCVTTTGRPGSPGHLNIDLGQAGLLPLRLRSTAVTPVFISNILPDLDCTVCYKKTVTIANLCK